MPYDRQSMVKFDLGFRAQKRSPVTDDITRLSLSVSFRTRAVGMGSAYPVLVARMFERVQGSDSLASWVWAACLDYYIILYYIILYSFIVGIHRHRTCSGHV